MKKFVCALLTLMLICLNGKILCQNHDSLPEISTSEEAIEWLNLLYTNRDYELGIIEAERLLSTFENEPGVEALKIIHMARFYRVDEAIESAANLLEKHPENPWAIYAKAVALRWNGDRRDEAMEYIKHGLEIAPEMAEIHALHIALLNATGKRDEAYELADKYLEITDSPARVMEMKGFMMNQLINERDDITRDNVFSYYREIREQDPHNLSAHYFAGIYHANANQINEATELLKSAAEISTAPEVNNRYWQTLIENDQIPRDEKIAIIKEGVKSLENRRPETPAMLHAFFNTYNSLGLTDESAMYGDRILENYNDTPQAEWVLVHRSREFRSAHSDQIRDGDEEVIAQYRRMLWDFLNRPNYHNPNLQGDFYLTLFMSMRNDENPDPDTLEMLLEGMVEYNPMNPHIVFAEAPASLAEKGGNIERSLELANMGFEKMKESIDRQKEWGMYRTDEEYEEQLNRAYSIINSAIGWIHFHAENLEMAEESLVKAHNLYPENRDNLYRMGQLYEVLGQPNNAESYYQMGLSTTGLGENPNKEALQMLYENIHGSLDGYDEYLERVLDTDRTTRQERILADRHDNPKKPPSFELNDINGERVSSDIMNNKIVAINFWGKWCGPCVAEMPDIQKLYENYADEDDVLILTINNDRSLSDLIEWMKDHEYTFPTLREDGYNSLAEISIYPTTWFLDRNGYIIYSQLGYTSELVEEFTWRIESLR